MRGISFQKALEEAVAEEMRRDPRVITMATDYVLLRGDGSDRQGGVGAGASFDVSTTWTATNGTQKFQVYVDPTGNALKNTAAVASQIKEININVSENSAIENRINKLHNTSAEMQKLGPWTPNMRSQINSLANRMPSMSPQQASLELQNLKNKLTEEIQKLATSALIAACRP